MYNQLLELIENNTMLSDLKYSKYMIRCFKEMNYGFDYIYNKLEDELNKKKNENLSERLESVNRILEENTKGELEYQFDQIYRVYKSYLPIKSASQLLNFFDEVRGIPFFKLADKSVGNKHVNAYINTHLRELVEEEYSSKTTNKTVKNLFPKESEFDIEEMNVVHKFMFGAPDDIDELIES